MFMHGDINIVTQDLFFSRTSGVNDFFFFGYVTKISNLIVYTKYRNLLLPFDLKKFHGLVCYFDAIINLNFV